MLLLLLSYLVILLYIFFLIYEAGETRHNSRELPKKSYWTVYLFFIADVAVIAGSILEYNFTLYIDLRLWITGFCLIIVKILIKRWSMKILGKHYNVHIVVGKEHELIITGPYKYVRHPAYLARLLGMMGIPIMFNAFYTLAIVTCIDLVFIFIRITLEERELVRILGEKYLLYKKHTWAIIPFKTLLRRASSD